MIVTEYEKFKTFFDSSGNFEASWDKSDFNDVKEHIPILIYDSIALRACDEKEIDKSFNVDVDIDDMPVFLHGCFFGDGIAEINVTMKIGELEDFFINENHETNHTIQMTYRFLET